MMEEIMGAVNGLAGLAALVNGALLWPTVRALKSLARSHGRRLGALERGTLTDPRPVVSVKRPRRAGRKGHR